MIMSFFILLAPPSQPTLSPVFPTGLHGTAYYLSVWFIREEKGWPTVFTDETIKKIAEKHKKTPAQVRGEHLNRGRRGILAEVEGQVTGEQFHRKSFK